MDITPEEILYKIVKEVHYLHLLKIVHGDLKPTNVLDSSAKGDLGPMLKIADFGLRHHTNESGSVEQQFIPACTEGWYCPFDPIDGKGGRSLPFDIFPLAFLFGFVAAIKGRPSARKNLRGGHQTHQEKIQNYTNP